MERYICPKCGQQTADETSICRDCAHTLNGKLVSGGSPAGVPDGKLPPELREWADRAFDKEAFLADLADVERTGGVELKDFIHEIEQGGASRE
jgi:hypothetical protein